MASHHQWTRRHVKRTIWIVAICVALLLLISGCVVAYAFATKRWALTGWLGLTGLFGLSGLLQLFWVIPVRRKIIAHDGKVCGNCLFVLNGLGDQGICPECGDEFVLEETVAGWSKDFRMPLDNSGGPASQDPQYTP